MKSLEREEGDAVRVLSSVSGWQHGLTQGLWLPTLVEFGEASTGKF